MRQKQKLNTKLTPPHLKKRLEKEQFLPLLLLKSSNFLFLEIDHLIGL